MKGASNKEDSLIKEALIKKAVGYDLEEITEEYQESEGEVRLVKKKITKKSVPPDVSAIKMLIDDLGGSYEEMTDAELEKEKLRLLEILKELENKE